MNAYPPEAHMPAEPEPDPRVVAMHRVVDLEQQCYEEDRKAEYQQKQAAIVHGELDTARQELHDLLGVSNNVRAMSGEEARGIARGAVNR